MMKRLLLIVILLTLVACGQEKEPRKKEALQIPREYIEEMSLSDPGHRKEIGWNPTFNNFIDFVNGMTYDLYDYDEVEDLLDEDQSYFRIRLTMSKGFQYFYIYEDLMVAYYTPQINEPMGNLTYHVLRDDQIHTFYDELQEIEFSDFDVLCKKPVIYLYPESQLMVDLVIDPRVILTTTYPAYDQGWQVMAFPDGRLEYEERSYDYLYWEGLVTYDQAIEEGFVVKKEDLTDFLEEKLDYMGLNYREANDFISYWLPDLQAYPYVKMRFLTEDYHDLVPMTIKPEPDSMIRVFMVFEGLEVHETIKEQVLTPGHRQGFTLVEWGGAELKSHKE